MLHEDITFRDLVKDFGFIPDGWGGYTLEFADGSFIRIQPLDLDELKDEASRRYIEIDQEEDPNTWCLWHQWSASYRAWIGEQELVPVAQLYCDLERDLNR